MATRAGSSKTALAAVATLLGWLAACRAEAAPGAPAGGALSAAEERGREIYRTGVSPGGGRIMARLGGSTTDVPASLLVCANCHGRDGVGRPEGGITPPNLRWHELTAALGPSHPSGRQRPAYDDRTLRRAITMGLDPAGAELDSAMPRYRMSHEDCADLVAYLKRIGTDPDPGVRAEELVLGTVLAPSGSMGAMHRGVKRVLSAYFDALNRDGGIYGRRVELRFCELPEAAGGRAAAVAEFLDEHEVFALVAAFVAGADRAITALAAERSVPVIGAFSLHPEVGFPPNRYVFYLYSGLADQGRALAAFAAKRFGDRRPPAAVVFRAGDERMHAVADAVAAECRQLGWANVTAVGWLPSADLGAVVGDLQAAGVEAVFGLLAAARADELLRRADAADWRPYVLVPGPLAGRDVLRPPSRLRDRLFLAFPTLPSDHSPAALAELAALAEGDSPRAEHTTARITALAAAKTLVDALQAVGRDVGREQLVEQLETFYERRNGLTPPLSFGPNRRVGARGAYVVGIDPDRAGFVPVTGFVETRVR